MQLARVNLTIRGRVQGVFYRAFTRDIATQLGLRGWARNLSDGNVEVLMEGYRDEIEKAIEHCRSGPPGARVDDIVIAWEEYRGDLQGFQIKYY